MEKGTEQLSFVVALTIINVPEGTIVRSSFEKIEEDQIHYINSSEEDLSKYVNISGSNDLYSGTHAQMVFNVEADAVGFGYYIIKVAIEVAGEILEEDTILIPIKQEGIFDE